MDIRIAEQFSKYLPLLSGKSVLEIGSLDVNGSIRPFVELFARSYIGVDITLGKNVDEICNIENIVDRFGVESFDAVVCLETLEHIRNWKTAVNNIKRVVKKGGLVLISAPTIGFEYHAYPTDFWRYQPSDFCKIFSDFEILQSKEDYRITTFVARKPLEWDFVQLGDFKIGKVEIPKFNAREFAFLKLRQSIKSIAGLV